MLDNTTHCATCGRAFSLFASKHTTGYGEDATGVRYCFQCCGDRDREKMKETGKATLYFFAGDDVRERGIGGKVDPPRTSSVTNWPGTLRFPVHIVSVSRNNWRAKRIDFRFTGPDGATWYGRKVGESSDLVNVRRSKANRERTTP